MRKLLLIAMVAAATAAPKVWNEKEAQSYRLPLAALGKSPQLISEQEYYKLPEVNLKTYPVYTPDKEPAGYLEYLQKQDPQPLVDIEKIKTDADWIAAGREVFYGRELPRFTGSEDNLQLIRNPQVLAAYRLPTTNEGVLLGLRYVVRGKGKVELGTDTCVMCHVQVRNGQVIEGPPNTYTPFGPIMGDLTRRYAQMSRAMFEQLRLREIIEDYKVPFLKDDPNMQVANGSVEEIAHLYDIQPPGVQPRTNTSLLYPVKIANLIGIQDLHYLDRTATSRHRGISDLMRYSALIADVTDATTAYGTTPDAKNNLVNMGLPKGILRTPDALLYALARYIYSLKPPVNPNPMDDRARHGQQVFQQSGCVNCHTPPLYTNNKLTLAQGFTPGPELLKSVDALQISVGTDPGLALKTRKGTGFYKVPSLRMVWLESALLHDGSLGSLEDMFNPVRLKPDFRSSNWSPAVPSHAVAGHTFGLNLSESDRAALIAFLRTL
jgi:mono/diheme cytochrome c family protein